ncbi:hypothetical protein PQE66_gp043 [Bacillus phage PBC2]|uniref:Uncharacterized protein n=1 Tax=Bacillus phage PBC2 TaxID=1675029 RepID=A0A218KBU7_9CAUD|nr:hypothetical protein PQE66_gp043 [Bacillus phage PBC2]AKQ08358.1 hypothetical protein PBC2_043 [Bacillus phage PBC2]
MIISEFDLMKWATAYIEDGKLIKWRYDNIDPAHMDSILNVKSKKKEALTDVEYSYIMTFDHVVIVYKHGIRLHRFSGDVQKF